uniref:Uncharacterized protein n=1 Tax=Oryza sativa subsp. japonica TaxID=39947 RepID=Q6Z4Q1_ORYSJ|nr:hypothetical protein [Oryza sativa Japonica Group]
MSSPKSLREETEQCIQEDGGRPLELKEREYPQCSSYGSCHRLSLALCQDEPPPSCCRNWVQPRACAVGSQLSPYICTGGEEEDASWGAFLPIRRVILRGTSRGNSAWREMVSSRQLYK